MFHVVIPARFDSSRFPGKPLADIRGQSMIERVWRQATQSRATSTIVATDDQRIADEVIRFGGEVVMTRTDHANGTSRLSEVAAAAGWSDEEVVVNVQGDEPLIPPAVIRQVADNLLTRPEAGAATLCEAIRTTSDVFNPNICKVVVDASGCALYFSRAPIPYDRDSFSGQADRSDTAVATNSWHRHIGIYAYRVGLLQRYVDWPMSPLETLESLEQLRLLHHGVKIHVAEAVAAVPGGIDTPADLTALVALMDEQAQEG